MPITTWKIMVRRADQTDYHYAATHQRGRAPTLGEELELVVEERMVKWTVAEIVKDDRSSRRVDVFIVMVDETERVRSGDPAGHIDSL